MADEPEAKKRNHSTQEQVKASPSKLAKGSGGSRYLAVALSFLKAQARTLVGVGVLGLVVTIVALVVDICDGALHAPRTLNLTIRDSNPGAVVRAPDQYLHRLAVSNETTNPMAAVKVDLDVFLSAGTARAAPASFSGECTYEASGTSLVLKCATLPVSGTEIVFSTSPEPLHGEMFLSADGAKTTRVPFNCALPEIAENFGACELTLPFFGIRVCPWVNAARNWIF